MVLTSKEESIAVQIANNIIEKCRAKEREEFSLCALSRVLGLQYILDIYNLLPEDHPSKKHALKIFEIVDLVSNQVIAAIK